MGEQLPHTIDPPLTVELRWFRLETREQELNHRFAPWLEEDGAIFVLQYRARRLNEIALAISGRVAWAFGEWQDVRSE